MNENLHVLIIEDDFRVAEINRQLVEQIDGFQVKAVAKTAAEAIGSLNSGGRLPELILLDVFIPDRTGLELYWEIRRTFPQIDIIMLSAAKETATIEEVWRGGVFDYLIKPVDFERFEKALIRYREQKNIFSSNQELEQSDIDRLAGWQPTPSLFLPVHRDGPLPKGIDQLTLIGVLNILQESGPHGVNAMETGKAVGVSRSTARRYLEHLVSIGEATAQLNYGEIGRPERRYVPWTK
ncbi:response regulator [Planomicrobium sp. CPCC 101110]|uniref:response regulator n=1 Tax=Planomicrobium sp. CPCC 101110 TaxID=2599619 RepID=UPI0011B41CB6|nr:response regulator [Planomicrobium sp. CPCC 101110]TWT25248.1 response regulator [Planomicrobium sp. CPCC 101110]